jgi:hypothetical protein
MDGFILAIDLGRFNSVLCWYEPTSRAGTFRTAATTQANRRRDCGEVGLRCDLGAERTAPVNCLHVGMEAHHRRSRRTDRIVPVHGPVTEPQVTTSCRIAVAAG